MIDRDLFLMIHESELVDCMWMKHDKVNRYLTMCSDIINPAKKETPHSFKGQQLENKLLYHLVIYIGLWVKFLALI